MDGRCITAAMIWSLRDRRSTEMSVRAFIENAAEFPSCFASSYTICSKTAVLDLWKLGVEPWILDSLKPTITVSEW